MKPTTKFISIVLLTALYLTAKAGAGEDQVTRHVITVKTDAAEIVTLDVSDLAVGESRTAVTESGSMIDVLRDANGIELYINGEVQDFEFGRTGQPHDHDRIHRRLEVECAAESADEWAQEYVLISGDHPEAVGARHVVRKHVEIICSEGEHCVESVNNPEDADIAAESLHPQGSQHELIVVRRHEDEL